LLPLTLTIFTLTRSPLSSVMVNPLPATTVNTNIISLPELLPREPAESTRPSIAHQPPPAA
jgi:hypothetical protein